MSGVRWKQQADPNDKAWVIVTMRIPNTGMPTATYSGPAAVDRIERFARAFLHGFTSGNGAGNVQLGDEEKQALSRMKTESATLPTACHLRGWLFAMTRTVAGEAETFTLSARLDPMRSTTELDWAALGRCTQHLGAPADEAMATTDPAKWRVQTWTAPRKTN